MSEPAHAPLPPLPSHCPACDAVFPEGATLCPNCGTRLTAVSSGLTAAKILGVICLTFVALVAGAVGACSVVVLVVGSGGPGFGSTIGIALIFLVPAVLVLVACFFGIKRLLKRK